MELRSQFIVEFYLLLSRVAMRDFSIQSFVPLLPLSLTFYHLNFIALPYREAEGGEDGGESGKSNVNDDAPLIDRWSSLPLQGTVEASVTLLLRRLSVHVFVCHRYYFSLFSA